MDLAEAFATALISAREATIGAQPVGRATVQRLVAANRDTSYPTIRHPAVSARRVQSSRSARRGSILRSEMATLGLGRVAALSCLPIAFPPRDG